MKKNLGKVIFAFCIFLVIGGIVFYRYQNRVRYNDFYVNGNSAGNLYNEGLFCEHNGTIFFANPNDNNSLYRMDSDGSNVTKILDQSIAYINADDHYVYYVKTTTGKQSDFGFLHVNTNSLCRLRQDGKGQAEVLDDDPCIYASLVGNYIYYLHYDTDTATTLYKVNIDGSERGMIKNNSYFTCSTLGQNIYFNGLENDHNVYQFDTSTDSQTMFYEGNCWMPTMTNATTLYYMDCENNYAITRADLSTGEKMLVCEDRVDCYNVYGDYIYFQRNDSENPALCRVKTDGSDYQEIKTGIYTAINVTSHYVYFRDYSSEIMYQMPIDGSGPVVQFKL